MKKGRLGTVHDFTLSATSQQTSAFGAQTYCVRIATTDQPAFFLVGTDPTVTAQNGHIMPAAAVDYITVTPGQKIAVLQAGTAGEITITEME